MQCKAEHFKGQFTWPISTSWSRPLPTDTSTLSEMKVVIVIGLFKRQKTFGRDELHPSLSSDGDQPFLSDLSTRTDSILLKGQIASRWRESMSVPNYKKDDNCRCEEHRIKFWQNIASKLLTGLFSISCLVLEKNVRVRIKSIFISSLSEKCLNSNTRFTCPRTLSSSIWRHHSIWPIVQFCNVVSHRVMLQKNLLLS